MYIFIYNYICNNIYIRQRKAYKFTLGRAHRASFASQVCTCTELRPIGRQDDHPNVSIIARPLPTTKAKGNH